MERYRLNPDEKIVDAIYTGLKKKGGYCPCKIPKIPENLCPCNDFLFDGDCHCKLWVKIEEEE